MGLNFLRDYGACRAGMDTDGPALFGDNHADAADSSFVLEEAVTLDYEAPLASWQPIDVRDACPPAGWPHRPQRFVDGKDVGRTIAWMQSPAGLPVPIRLAQIGAIALYAQPGTTGLQLRCETRQVEKVVSFMADAFPWHEVESFTAALHACGFRVLIVTQSHVDAEQPYDFEQLRDSAKSRTINEMLNMERQATTTPSMYERPTVLDGSLQTKSRAFTPSDPVAGVIKTHAHIPLHPQGFRTLTALRACQRTPVYERRVSDGADHLRFLTWFVRLGPQGGESPPQCVVRVEINKVFFEEVIGGKYEYVNCLSYWLCRCRTRDAGYGRAAITIYPIQRAEDMLRAHFCGLDTLISRFYHLTNL